VGWLSIWGNVLDLGLLGGGSCQLEGVGPETKSSTILGYRGVSSTYVSIQMHTISILPLYLPDLGEASTDPLISVILWFDTTLA